jgi:hypothetical protein
MNSEPHYVGLKEINMIKRFLQTFLKMYRSTGGKILSRTPAQSQRRLFLLRYFSLAKVFRFSRVLGLVWINCFAIYFITFLVTGNIPDTSYLPSAAIAVVVSWVTFISISAIIHYNDILQIILAVDANTLVDYLGLAYGFIVAVGINVPFDFIWKMLTNPSDWANTLLFKELVMWKICLLGHATTVAMYSADWLSALPSILSSSFFWLITKVSSMKAAIAVGVTPVSPLHILQPIYNWFGEWVASGIISVVIVVIIR